ncbi:MAG: GIY-YIG nuclease family protein [Sphingobium sp.]|nr:GIY-YIG nuclease family protein [Sphingobium sp.]
MTRDLEPVVYLMASRRNGTLYIGVTSNLIQRIAQHRDRTLGGFTAEHGVKLLVWFEVRETMESAILREAGFGNRLRFQAARLTGFPLARE